MFFAPGGLWVSVAFFATVALTAHALRLACKQMCTTRFQRVLAKEFLCAMEVTCSCFEFGTVLRQDGLLPFSVILFSLILWRKMAWQYPEEETIAFCPCNDITQSLTGRIPLPLAVTKNLMDVLSSPIAFLLCASYWRLGLRSGHFRSLAATAPANCVSEIRVSLGPAMLTEAMGTLLLCFIWGSIRKSGIPGPVGTTLGAIVSVGVIDAALPYTGGYFHPALASAKMWGCRGSSPLEHVMTYWVAPLSAEFSFEVAKSKLLPSDEERKMD